MENNYLGLDSLKTASKRVANKTGEFLGNSIADTVTNLCNQKVVKTEPFAEIISPPEKRDEILNKLRQVL